jgi:hypothetical protein
LLENCHERTDTIPSPTRVTKEKKRTKRKNQEHAKTRAHVIALFCLAMAGGQNAHAGRIVIIAGIGQKHSPRSQGKKGAEL